MAELRCAGVTKSYGKRSVLEALDLEVPSGSFTAILGASGAGKTTFLRVVMGLDEVDDGTIVVGGQTMADGRVHVATERRRIGYVSQEGALFPQLTVSGNVAFGLPRAERAVDGRVAEVLHLVGLDTGYAHRRPAELSGGEQRRVALARALAPRPQLVLLDEPFSGLDAALRSETRETIKAALAAEGTTTVLVTHDQAEALSLGEEVAVLRDGRLVQKAEPEVLYRSPVDLEVARFVGEAVVLSGLCDGRAVRCALGVLPVTGPAGHGPVQVMIRPEQIRISGDAEDQGAGAESGTLAQVADHRYYGPDAVVRLHVTADSGPHEELMLSAKMFSYELPKTGESVRITVRGTVVVYSGAGAPEEVDPPSL